MKHAICHATCNILINIEKLKARRRISKQCNSKKLKLLSSHGTGVTGMKRTGLWAQTQNSLLDTNSTSHRIQKYNIRKQHKNTTWTTTDTIQKLNFVI